MASANTHVRTDIQDSATAERRRATREVQLSVLKRLHPDLDLTGKSDDYVTGYFDQATSSLSPQSQAKPSTKLDSMGSRTKTKRDLMGSRIIKVPSGAVSKDRVRSRHDSTDDLPEWLQPLATSRSSQVSTIDTTSKGRPVRFDSAYVPEWQKPLATSKP